MKKQLLFLCIFLLIYSTTMSQNGIVVFQTDFGSKDGAVSAMKGVASSVSANLKLYDLTQEIPAYNIWEAAYRLDQTVPYWPAGTVFVSVMDPGVGTDRKSIVAKTKSGHYIVTPDNGTLTLLAASIGIESMREIDEAVNRRKNSGASYTFHGRDVYAYTAARLASKTISFESVGQLLAPKPFLLSYQKASLNNAILKGNIDILDIQYGNLWTNIGQDLWKAFNALPHDKNIIVVKVLHQQKLAYQGAMPFENTFGGVAVGKPLAYLNSLMQLSFVLNQGSMAEKYNIGSGPDWTVEITWGDYLD
jgi:S-adenosylmethionine hydrolase